MMLYLHTLILSASVFSVNSVAASVLLFGIANISHRPSTNSEPSCPSLPSVKPPAVLASAPSGRSTSALAELPAPSASAFGQWVLSAVAAASVVLLAKQLGRKTPLEAEFLSRKEFSDFKDKVDHEFTSLRDRIDHSFSALSDKLDGINNRLHEVRALVDRLDERTKTTSTHELRPKQ